MKISEYLDHELRSHIRIRDLEALAEEVVAQPLNEFLCELRVVLKKRRLTGGDNQRLHVLLSQLYHASADVDGALVDCLRSEVTIAWELSRSHAHTTREPRQ